MKKPRRDPIREDRIENEAIVDARPEEQAMGWYYYLEGKIRFPFQAKCIAANVVSPLRKGETLEVVRMTPEDNCEHDMFAGSMARPEAGNPALATGCCRSGRIDRGSHRRLALLGRAGLHPLSQSPLTTRSELS
jgi:Calcium binding